MIREYKLTFQLSCKHDAHEMHWNEAESKWDLWEFARSMRDQKLFCNECKKERKVIGHTIDLENIIYRDRKEWREVNYPSDKWLDVLP